jgi:hypothetical protein
MAIVNKFDSISSLSMSGMVGSPEPSTEEKAAMVAREQARGTELSTITAGSSSSGWSAVGGLEDENRYAMSSLMVTNPEAYARHRLTALNKVKESVNATYNITRQQFLDAGLALSEAEKRATAAAATARTTGMTAMGAKFPLSNDTKLLGVQRKSTNKF